MTKVTRRRTPRLTDAMLRRAGACADQRAIFRATFPDGAPLTLAAWRTASAAGLDINWTHQLLSASARAEYERATAPAWAAYERATAAAWPEYERARAAAWAEYDRATAPALLRALRQSLADASSPREDASHE